MADSTRRTFSDQDVVARLVAELPSWQFGDGHIRRTYKTHGWKSTLMVVNVIGHLAEAAWHHPELKVKYSSIEVALRTHDADGITAKDFDLARKIEDVVLWQPGKAGALEGTPQDARYAYLKYD